MNMSNASSENQIAQPAMVRGVETLRQPVVEVHSTPPFEALVPPSCLRNEVKRLREELGTLTVLHTAATCSLKIVEAEAVRLQILERAAIELVQANDAHDSAIEDLRSDRPGSSTIPKGSPAFIAGDRHAKAQERFWVVARQVTEAAKPEQVQGTTQ